MFEQFDFLDPYVLKAGQRPCLRVRSRIPRAGGAPRAFVYARADRSNCVTQLQCLPDRRSPEICPNFSSNISYFFTFPTL